MACRRRRLSFSGAKNRLRIEYEFEGQKAVCYEIVSLVIIILILCANIILSNL